MPNPKNKEIPKPISKRQHMYITSECDVTLYGGKSVPPFKTPLIR